MRIALLLLSASIYIFPLISARALNPPQTPVEVTARISGSHPSIFKKDRKNKMPPAVMWLIPLTSQPAHASSVEQRPSYTLLQKNKTFIPHILIVPVGSTVLFPNTDPFFHNVFSLFDGKRFDLGLYEAGTTKSVLFSREGVSYIFCNIHSEMSAVVLALSTPFYGTSDTEGNFHLNNVPAGAYEMRLWIEGEKQQQLDRLTKHVRIAPGEGNLGSIHLELEIQQTGIHLNKFGEPYNPDTKPAY